MKTALCLSGGGLHGSFQVGAFQYLIEQDVKFDFIAGISAGALNGALIAQDKFEELKQYWNLVYKNGIGEIFESLYVNLEDNMKINFHNVSQYFFKDQNVISLLSKGGRTRFQNKFNKLNALTNSNPLKEKLKTIKIDDFKIPYMTGAVSLTDGKFHYAMNTDFNSDEQMRNFIRASASIPVVVNPVEKVKTKNDTFTNLVDGGIRCILPLKQTIDYIKSTGEKWRVIVINCSSGELEPLNNITHFGQIGLRSLNDIALNQILKNDLKTTEIINNFVIASGKEELDGYRYIPITKISPEGVEMGNILDSSKIEFRFNQGYKIAKQVWN